MCSQAGRVRAAVSCRRRDVHRHSHIHLYGTLCGGKCLSGHISCTFGLLHLHVESKLKSGTNPPLQKCLNVPEIERFRSWALSFTLRGMRKKRFCENVGIALPKWGESMCHKVEWELTLTTKQKRALSLSKGILLWRQTLCNGWRVRRNWQPFPIERKADG